MKEDRGRLNIFNIKKNKKQQYAYYDQNDDDDTEVKGGFKIYLLILAAIMIIYTIWNFNYLGGIEGIMTSKRLPEEGFRGYFGAVGSLFLMPALAAIFLWLAFRKPKTHQIDDDKTEDSVEDTQKN